MAQKSFEEIRWATPERPHGLWANCIICDQDIRELSTRKNTCSEECHALKIKMIDNRSYAKQVANDPEFAKKQSANQYARIKADPEKMEAHRMASKERRKLPNYQESLRKSQAKYRSNLEAKAKIAKRTRKYRDENMHKIADIEARRIQKRSQERQRLKLEEPEKYAELRAKERQAEQRRKAEKRLFELQADIQNMVTKDE